VGRGVYPVAALADGAGNANLAARKALAMFSKFHSDTEKSCPMDLLTAETGRSGLNCWIRICLGVRSQLFAPSRLERLRILRGKRRDVAVGCAVGDSRLFLITRKGETRIITGEKARLGSGQARAVTFKIDLVSGDFLVLATDGAFSPMSIAELQKIVATKSVQHPSEVPLAIIERAAKYGNLADDATAVADSQSLLVEK